MQGCGNFESNIANLKTNRPARYSITEKYNNSIKNSIEGLITVSGKKDKSEETIQNKAQRGYKDGKYRR